MPHPLIPELQCVGFNGKPVTNNVEHAWLQARRLGITASTFGELVTRTGAPSKSRHRAVRAKVFDLHRDLSFINAIALGNRGEAIIAQDVENVHGIRPNQWLIASHKNVRFLATPDGISDSWVAEYKTSVKSWGHNLHTYYRQLQWQMMVTERERSIFVVMNPNTEKMLKGVVPRDEGEIQMLKIAAEETLALMDSYGVSTTDESNDEFAVIDNIVF